PCYRTPADLRGLSFSATCLGPEGDFLQIEPPPGFAGPMVKSARDRRGPAVPNKPVAMGSRDALSSMLIGLISRRPSRESSQQESCPHPGSRSVDSGSQRP